MAKSSTYWQGRFDQIEQSANNRSTKYVKQLEKKYQIAAQQIDGQINAWYQRLADNNGVSMTEARKLLTDSELDEFKWTVAQYIEAGKENAIDQRWLRELENASAKFHINRLEALKLDVRQQIEQAFAGGQQSMYDVLADVYSDTFYRSCFEIQKGVGVGFDVSKLDDKQVSTLLQKPWSVDGTNFSEKLWSNKTKLINNLDQELSRMVLTGESPQRAIANIRKAMDTSQYAAKRLVMTEQAYFTSVAQKDAYGELDVEEYEIVATLDNRTSKICQEQDGKHYPVKDMVAGVNAPPFHVFCRTTTCPYFDDEFMIGGKRIAKGDDGFYEVPANMTYPEWKKSFVDGGSKEDLTPVANDDVDDYLVSKKQYDDGVKKVQSLEKETDDLLDQYMVAMDTPDEARLEKLHSEKYEELESLREVVKDLKAQLSGKEAKAVRQIEKNFADLTGIPIDEVKMTGLQYDTAEMIYDSYDTVLEKFPELKGNLAKFTYDGVYGDAYASCVSLTGEIQAHGIFAKYDDLVKQYADDVAKGFHPIGTDHRSIIVHELGHALDGYMTKNHLLGADYNQFGIISTSSKTVRDMTLKMLGFDRQEIANELKNQGLTLFQRRDILEQREKDFIAKHVSGYATGYDSDGNALTNYPEREFFAECFAEYVMGENPREAAKVFGEIIETALGR